jgi:hypothetical protein
MRFALVPRRSARAAQAVELAGSAAAREIEHVCSRRMGRPRPLAPDGDAAMARTTGNRCKDGAR